ncbi:MAG TPA: hypothetical protein VG603_02375 [Chitinophagales bacterium]|nr:hypothetical protein [Chitinophagales bacterium]
MSDIISPLVACPAVQMRLNDLYDNYPIEPTPLTVFLSSNQNLQGIQLLPQYNSPGGGKIRKVQVVYTPRYVESDVSTGLTTDCNTDNKPAQSYAEYEIDTDTGVELKEQFPLRDLIISCQQNDSYIATRIMALLDGCRRKMETQITNELVFNMGKFAKSDKVNVSVDRTYKEVKTVYSDGKFNENALSEIYYSARQANFNSIPFIFGTGTIEKYFQALKAPANTYWGLDLGEYTDGKYVFMPSYRISDAFDTDSYEHFVALSTNSLVILQYNKFDGMVGLNTISGTNVGLVQDVIIDPITGMHFNYKWVYSPCGEYATAVISTAFQLAALPNDMFSSDDRLSGVRGSLKFRINNS